MRYVSTRGQSPAVAVGDALAAGLAPDGGLYMPQVLPALDRAVWTAARGATMAQIGTAMLGPLVGDEIRKALEERDGTATETAPA
jgi:threonine synthase